MAPRVLIVIGLGVAACRGPQSAVNRPPSAVSGPGFTARYHHAPTRVYKSFSINPVSDTGASLTAFNRQWIVLEARTQMVAKGLTPGDATADLLVNIVSVDSTHAGQAAGRPLNDWYRLFHGGTIRPDNTEGEIVGTLLPDSLLRSLDSGWVSPRERTVPKAAAKDTAAPPPVQKGPGLAYGALVIDVIDRDKRLLLWEGIANRGVDVPARDAEKRVQAIVRRLLEGYHPAIGLKDTAKGAK